MTDSPGLLDAMVAVQSEAPTLPKNATNPHYNSKFVPLDTIVEQIGPLLAKHNLVWTACPVRDEHGDPALRYRLSHAPSKEFIEGVMPLLLAKEDSQGMGSAITYARRYSLCAVLNLVADDDDDGNANTGEQAQASSGGKPSESQRKFLEQIVAGRARGIEKPTLDELVLMLEKIAPEVEVKPGWMDELSRQQASALLTWLKEGLRPSTVRRSDIPDVPFVATEAELT